MLRILSCVLGWSIVACGGGRSASPTPTTASSPEPVPAPATTVPEPTPAAAPAPPSAAGEAEVLQIADACRGPSLDLAELARGNTCRVRASGRPLPADVTLSIEPALVTVRGGGSALAAVVLTNHGPTAAQLVLNNVCGLADVETELLDTHG